MTKPTDIMQSIRLHQSTLERYRECPQRLLFDLDADRRPEFRSAAAVAGTVAHRILHGWHETGEQIGYSQTWDAVERSSKVPVQYPDNGKSPLEVVADYCAELEAWFPQYADRFDVYETMQVEHQWSFEFSTPRTIENPYVFEGRLDLLARLGNRVTLPDWKTGNMKPGDATMTRLLQFPLYAWAVEEEFGLLIDSFMWVHVKDWIPYARNTTKAKISHNAAWNEWAAAQGFDEANDGSKWKIPKGALRGPGIYEFPVTREWLEYWKKQIVRIAASMRRGNWYTGQGKYGCEGCDHLNACSALWSTTGTGYYDNLKGSEFLNA